MKILAIHSKMKDDDSSSATLSLGGPHLLEERKKQQEEEQKRVARGKEDQYHEKAINMWLEERQLRPNQVNTQAHLDDIYKKEMSQYIKSKRDQMEETIRKHIQFIDENVS